MRRLLVGAELALGDAMLAELKAVVGNEEDVGVVDSPSSRSRRTIRPTPSSTERSARSRRMLRTWTPSGGAPRARWPGR